METIEPLVWGTGPLDNIAAQELAWDIVREGPADLSMIGSHPARSLSVSSNQKLVGSLALLLISTGRIDSGFCPPFSKWLLEEEIATAESEQIGRLCDEVRRILSDSPLREFWRSQRKLGQWQSGIKDMLGVANTGRVKKIKCPVLSRRSMTIAMGAASGNVYPMMRGSSDLHVSLFRRIAPRDAIKMSAYPTVSSLSVYFDGNSPADDNDMIAPLRSLLFGWRNSLKRIELSVCNASYSTAVLDWCIREISDLQCLEEFDARCVAVNDDLLRALSKCQRLKRMYLSDASKVTWRGFAAFNGHSALSYVHMAVGVLSQRSVNSFTKKNLSVTLDLF